MLPLLHALKRKVSINLVFFICFCLFFLARWLHPVEYSSAIKKNKITLFFKKMDVSGDQKVGQTKLCSERQTL